MAIVQGRDLVARRIKEATTRNRKASTHIKTGLGKEKTK